MGGLGGQVYREDGGVGFMAPGTPRGHPHLLPSLLLLELSNLPVPLGLHQPPPLLLLTHLLHQGYLDGKRQQGWGGAEDVGSVAAREGDSNHGR